MIEDDIYGKTFNSRTSKSQAKHTGASRSRARTNSKTRGKRRAKSKNSLLSLLDFKNFKQNFSQMNKYQKRRLGALLIVIAIIIIIIIIANSGKKHVVPEITTFLYNNHLVSPKKELFSEEDVSYISIDDIYSMFDDNIVYDKDTKQLITTYNTHIAELKVDDKTMDLNGSEIKLKGRLQEKNGTIYLPFTDLGIVYDLEVDYSKDYNRVIASSIKDEKKRSIVLKGADLKENPSIFAKTVEKLPMSTYVFILEEAGNYKKVRSENGNIGYIANGKIGKIDTLRTKMVEESINYNIIDDANILNNYDDNQLSNEAKNVVIPNFFVLNDNSVVSDRVPSNNNYDSFIDWCKQKEVQIWGTLESNIDVSSELSNYESRNNTIQELYNQIMTYEFQGIMIDFEEIDDEDSMLRFIIEITPRFKESGLKVGVRLNSISEDKVAKIKSIVDATI